MGEHGLRRPHCPPLNQSRIPSNRTKIRHFPSITSSHNCPAAPALLPIHQVRTNRPGDSGSPRRKQIRAARCRATKLVTRNSKLVTDFRWRCPDQPVCGDRARRPLQSLEPGGMGFQPVTRPGRLARRPEEVTKKAACPAHSRPIPKRHRQRRRLRNAKRASARRNSLVINRPRPGEARSASRPEQAPRPGRRIPRLCGRRNGRVRWGCE